MKRLVRLQGLALPLTFSQLAFAANAFVTSCLLAKYSTLALNASLPGSMLAVAVSSLAISTFGYAGTICARRYGAGDLPGAAAAIRAALVLTVLSAPLFVLASPLGHAVLGLFNTSPEVLAAESKYYDVLLANGFLTTLAAVLGGHFTGQGKTRFVGAVTVFGFLVNMAIAPVFIGGHLGLPVSGIEGAGWAATAAHAVACAILAVAIRLRPMGAAKRAVERHDYHEILRLGLPSGVKAVVDIGGFFAFTAVVAECPSAAVAASTAAFAVNGIYMAFPTGLAQALEIMTAMSDAPGRRTLLSSATALVALYALAFCLVLALAGESALLSFGKPDDAATLGDFRSTTRVLLAILGVKAFFEPMVQVLQAFLRGCGKTATVFRVQFASSVLFWIPLYLGVRAIRPGVPAYWLTMLACAILSTALLARRRHLDGR